MCSGRNRNLTPKFSRCVNRERNRSRWRKRRRGYRGRMRREGKRKEEEDIWHMDFTLCVCVCVCVYVRATMNVWEGGIVTAAACIWWRFRHLCDHLWVCHRVLKRLPPLTSLNPLLSRNRTPHHTHKILNDSSWHNVTLLYNVWGIIHYIIFLYSKVVASGLLLRKAVVMSAEKKNFQTLSELTECMRWVSWSECERCGLSGDVWIESAL